jgi:hypothetical protein
VPELQREAISEPRAAELAAEQSRAAEAEVAAEAALPSQTSRKSISVTRSIPT